MLPPFVMVLLSEVSRVKAAAVIAFGLLFFPAEWVSATGVIELNAAEFVASTDVDPPGKNAGWTKVRLPDFWKRQLRDQRRGKQNGWYRLRFAMPEIPAEPWGVYLPRLSMNAAAYLNGAYVGDGGRMEEPVARNWNRPLLFTVPASAWHAGENVLHLRLRVSRNGYGVLAPIDVGPLRLLRSRFEHRRFTQNTLSVGLFFITGAVAVFMLGLWWRVRHERMYLLFGTSALAWSVFSLNLFVRYIPVSVDTWWWLVHSSIDWWVVLLALFAHRFADVRRPRLEAAMLLFAVIGTFFYDDLNPSGSFNRMNVIWHGGTLLIGAYMTAMLVSRWRQTRSGEIGAFAAMMVVLLVLGAHDWYMNTGWTPGLWLRNYNMLHFGAPVMFIVMTWHLTGRFIRALQESRRLNESLEARVDSARAELEHSYAEKAVMEKQQAAADERERLYRDLHDDMGAKLLSLVYRSESERNADLARSILEDLRDVVSRSERRREGLDDLLADVQAETRERLSDAGIALGWQLATKLPGVRLHKDAALNLVRVMREWASNVIHHAAAKSANVAIAADGQEIIIEMSDDGGLTDSSRLRPGRGMRNMLRRVGDLGGTIEWRQREPHGCVTVMRVPLSGIDAGEKGDRSRDSA